ncbi:MAG: RecR [uncultured Chloroflexi bacterium]|uniref:Recombination protein RecR n=1 Tax=uncultured Chloroflexota bacterium TaxID=166587 RepID=A0A6J4K260_9CHLR|nr:MAG: RecR [uncultured Chloroflexota bacterium]
MSQTLAEPIARLIEEFGKLPGVGPKTAQRLTFYLLRQPADEARALAEAIGDVKDKIIFCGNCFNLSADDPCPICADPSRNRTVICVVEEPLDILALDRTGHYRGLYHVLHGSFSPMEGVLEDDLKIRELVARVGNEPVEEVIIATNATVEGEATANLVKNRLRNSGARVTRLAQGLPIGSDLEYADDYTLSRALDGRREY